MSDELPPLHVFALNMVNHLLADGYSPQAISICLATASVAVVEAKLEKGQTIAHIRDLLSDIAGLQ